MTESNINFAPTFGFGAFVATWIALAALGCMGNSGTDNPVALEFGQKVIKKYDTNFDGLLTVRELSGLFGTRGKIKEEYDQDGDGNTSRDEIASCIDTWLKEGPTVRFVDVSVDLDGSRLAGATVRMVPDYDPGDGSQAIVSQTDTTGVARMEVALEDLSQALDNPDFRGVFATNFTVEVSHPQGMIPAKYSRDSEIKVVLPREATRTELRIELSSK